MLDFVPNVRLRGLEDLKRVLIVGADFVPSSLPPALRIRFFARHLPSFGWKPTVLTADSRCYEYSVDPENIHLLPQDLPVIRTGAVPARISKLLGIGDIGMRTMWQHWRAIKDLCRRSEVDLIFIPVPPYVPMALGRMAHDRFGVPYVIDYIDPWVTDYYWKKPKSERPPKWFLADALSRMVEPYALKHVGHMIGVSQGTTDGVAERYSWLSTQDGSEIPYGVEPSDFQYLAAHPRKNLVFDRQDGCFHISSVGRGGVDQFSILRALFEAVRLGLKEAPERYGRLRFHFVGTSYAANAASNFQVMPLAAEYGLQELVSERPGRVPYLDALQVLLDSHALVAIGSEEAHYTASKIFPYLLSGRPILAIFHQASSVLEILRRSRTGLTVAFGADDPIGGKATEIRTALDALSSAGEPAPPRALHELSDYTAAAMTAKLAAVFDNVMRLHQNHSLPNPAKDGQRIAVPK
jgi:hypothetical protein